MQLERGSEETIEARIPVRDQLGWIAGHWRPYRAEVGVLLVLTLANAAAVVLYPVILKRIVNGIEESLSTGYLVENVLLLLVLGFVMFSIYASLQTMRARLNARFDFGVRQRAFEHILRMGPNFFGRFRTGDLVTRLTDDVSDKLAWYLASGIFRFLEAAALIVFGVFMMIRMNPELTLWAAGPLPVLIGLFMLTGRRLEERYGRVQRSISALNEALEGSLSGIRVVKAFAAEPAHRRVVEGAIERQRREEVRAVRWQSVIDALYGHVWQFAIIGVLLAGGAKAIRGEISLGTLVAFDSYVLILVWPMFDVGQFFVKWRESAVTISRIATVEGAAPEVSEPGDAFPPVRSPQDAWIEEETEARAIGARAAETAERGDTPPLVPPRIAVRFEKVWYRYPGAERDTLSDLSFEARPGSLTALAGEVGSGKSTALALVPRLMDPAAGRILIGGRDARQLRPLDLRRPIGLVTQEAVLFSTTLGENVRFGRAEVSDDYLRIAIRLAQLGEEVAAWPEGLETLVGARGIRLSTGQKQRAALARALAGRPSVLLLDDCTASLDAETEDAVWRDLFRILPSCTAIVVTHRPATLERADRIILLAGGRAAETGTFAELHRPGTTFHRLYAQWRLEEKVAG